MAPDEIPFAEINDLQRVAVYENPPRFMVQFGSATAVTHHGSLTEAMEQLGEYIRTVSNRRGRWERGNWR